MSWAGLRAYDPKRARHDSPQTFKRRILLRESLIGPEKPKKDSIAARVQDMNPMAKRTVNGVRNSDVFPPAYVYPSGARC
ncbi:hypothetical protein FGB62_395g02 [Gracilaria domingensis]|nr:hypothetical protein FGB62_395g02 [Gracilaria domingensis]